MSKKNTLSVSEELFAWKQDSKNILLFWENIFLFLQKRKKCFFIP